MDGDPWYTRVRGIVRGPFSIEELKAQRATGQFSRFHEISSDNVVWTSAASLAEVFEAPLDSRGSWATDEEPLDIDELPAQLPPEPPRPQVAPKWHYTIGGKQHGPVSIDMIETMLVSGELTDRDMLWQPGWGNWRVVKEAPEVSHLPWQRLAATATQRTSSPAAQTAQQRVQPNPNSPSPILMAVLSGCCVVGLGQMVLGQVGKGIVILAISFVLALITVGFSALVMFPLVAIDAYMVAKKLRSGRNVSQWECFPT